MKRWFISHTHFSHKNIIKYAGRPYEAVKNERSTGVCRRFRGWSFFVFVPQANAWGYMLLPLRGLIPMLQAWP